MTIALASVAFVALGVTATQLDHIETTRLDGGQGLTAHTVPGVTVAWLTDYDPLLGGESVVGATIVPVDGALLGNSSVELTIVGAGGTKLGTLRSDDGGATWSELDDPVAAGDSLVASVVIDDRATVAAISPAH
ncbi:hypothetical protein [Conyzicola sp.]|uniref:hypothetical protein n=1 Tax=Conyzicola sp. TaxID=1969404 RepID=UPI0039894E26